MPGYYQRPMASRLPPTPPDSGTAFSYSSVPYTQDPYAAQQNMNQVRHDAGYDFQQGYLQPAGAQAPPAYPYQQSGYQSNNSLPPIQTSYYEPLGAPILPPIRTYDRDVYNSTYQQQLQAEHNSAAAREQHRQAQKEEKATGGVSAKLDYDMDRMTDFVVQATQSILNRSTPMNPSFRKWVHQVLSATRLPSATILLSLYYFNDRLQAFAGSVRQNDENQIYRLLAVALILGSKFLDDNTFINRSWSDVTSIKVSELNLLEMQWLDLINYQLHIPLEGLPSKKYSPQGWIDAWQRYDKEYLIKQQQPARLSPLDTNVQRHAMPREARYSPYPTPYTASSRTFDTSLSARGSQYSTPYSAADPWASHNERHSLDHYYAKRQQEYYPDYAEIEAVSRRASEERAQQSAYAFSSNSQQSYYHTPTYSSTWDQHAWGGPHPYDCRCSTCAYQHHYRPYGMGSSYVPQSVMG